MFEDVKIGDKVWSFTQGWGEVIEDVTEGVKYPIIVEFEDGINRFTADGKLYVRDKYQTLFWNEVIFDIPNKPMPDLDIDTEVLVWNDEDEEKHERYFKRFDKYGKIVCFARGATNWESDGDETVWEHWELAE